MQAIVETVWVRSIEMREHNKNDDDDNSTKNNTSQPM